MPIKPNARKLKDCMLTKAEEEEIFDLLKDGLMTDGDHHKQWYLEEIAKVLGMRERLIESLHEDDCPWEEGIPP